MAYSDFTLADLESKFGMSNRKKRLFEKVKAIPLTHRLKEELIQASELPMRTEKAKSEWIVAPILGALRRRNDKFFTIHSGENLSGDEALGLKGECDFILSKDSGSFDLNYPIFQIVEAKKNDIDIGVPQCAAQLIGAQKFHAKKGVEVDVLYGCVTTGNDWLFLKLENQVLWIDTKLYYLDSITEILGVFQVIIDEFKDK